MTIGSRIKPGQTYGNWTVMRRSASTDNRRRVTFVCRCVCGREFEVLGQNLTNGRSTQCRPCASHERAHLIHIPREVYNRLYQQARGAIRRCDDSDNDYYAGRGISVYHVWRDDIRLFIEYLVTLPGYNDDTLVIDRVNNDGNYEPGNIRFTTWSESNYNRRLPR